jgi:hypothetical protein
MAEENVIDIFEITKHYKNEEDRMMFLLSTANSIYENTAEEHKKKATRKFVSKFLDVYTYQTETFRNDPRLLHAWHLLASVSNSMGYNGVMEKLDGLQYYVTCADFYKLWATYLVEKKDRPAFEKLHTRVFELFHRNKDVVDLFATFAKQLGPKPFIQDEDATVNVFAKITGGTPLRAPLSVVNEESERTNSSRSSIISTARGHSSASQESVHNVVSASRSSTTSTARGHSSVSQESVHSNVSASRSNNLLTARSSSSSVQNNDENAFVLNGPVKNSISSSSTIKTAIAIEPSTNIPASNFSFTTQCYRNARDAFGETLPLSQEVPERHIPAPIEPIGNRNDKDFSVFVEDEEPMDTRNVPQSAPIHSRISIAQDSPVTKKSRNRRDSDEELETSYDNPFGDVGGLKKPMFSSNAFDNNVLIDDPTISGLNKQASTRASSTPTGANRGSVPTFEVSPTATFPLVGKPEESQPFTFAPSVPVKPASPPSRRSVVVPISEAISRMSIIPPPAEDLDETTHDVTIMPDVSIKTGSINPWSENERVKVLKMAPPMVEQHEFLAAKCPPFNTKNASVNLGGETFKILKFIAQGGFARIYKTQGEDGKQYAIKLEMPSCPWEVYICKALSVRLPQEMQPFVMNVRDAFIFSNASAIVYDFYPMKTLLDLANSFKQDGSSIDGMIVAHVGIQIAEILNYVKKANIIHADIKPDNFVIVDYLSTDLPHLQYIKPFVKLIDWGRAIDMSYYPNQTFKGRAGTNGFDCHEMQEDRPWTYQTDFYGFVGTMHVLMFNTYMKTFWHAARKCYTFTEQLKRRYPLFETWTNIFREFLNIPDCDKMPSWEKVVTQLKQDLEDFATEDIASWRRAVDKCNSVLRNSITNN